MDFSVLLLLLLVVVDIYLFVCIKLWFQNSLHLCVLYCIVLLCTTNVQPFAVTLFDIFSHPILMTFISISVYFIPAANSHMVCLSTYQPTLLSLLFSSE